MSITSALAGALSGLSATARQAEILSSNVANATTPGYARRQVGLGAAVLAGQGKGVQVLGVTRDVDRYLLGERRIAQAGGGDRDVRAEFLKRLEQAVGTPESAGSLAARLASFDQAFARRLVGTPSMSRASAMRRRDLPSPESSLMRLTACISAGSGTM